MPCFVEPYLNPADASEEAGHDEWPHDPVRVGQFGGRMIDHGGHGSCRVSRARLTARSPPSVTAVRRDQWRGCGIRSPSASSADGSQPLLLALSGFLEPTFMSLPERALLLLTFRGGRRLGIEPALHARHR